MHCLCSLHVRFYGLGSMAYGVGSRVYRWLLGSPFQVPKSETCYLVLSQERALTNLKREYEGTVPLSSIQDVRICIVIDKVSVS